MLPQTIDINPKSEKHRFIVRQLQDRIQAARFGKWRSEHLERWERAEDRLVAYMPERDVDKARDAERKAGKPQYTTIMLPYSYAVLMAAHTYWTTVFLSRDPILQFVGRHGESQQQSTAVEALMNYQTTAAGHAAHYHHWLFDAGKYGFGIVGCYWDEEMHTVSEVVEEDEQFLGVIPTGKTVKRRVTKEIVGYQGNKLFNVRPQDFLHDPRVPIWRLQEGEFCGTYCEVAWNKLYAGQARGRYQNVDMLKTMRSGRNYYGSQTADDRDEGSDRQMIPDANDFGSAFVEKQAASDNVKLYEMYIEIIPSQWGLGKSDMPEKWVFTTTADYELLLEARPLGNYHNKFPFTAIQMEPDAYRTYSRGYMDILNPVQNTVDWLFNTHFYNVRKTLNNQFIVDPSRVVMRDFENPMPGGYLRLSPAGYGQDIRTVVQQLQTMDVTQNHMRDLQTVLQLGERVSGVNDAVMGMQAPSSRRSAAEVRSSNTFAINRLKTLAEYMSVSGFGQHAGMMLQNTQQYMEAPMKVRVTGDLSQIGDQQMFLDIDPEAISGMYDFVPVDGTLPVDRFAQANLWRELLGQMRNFPEIMVQYDIGKIFAFVAQLTGLKNINQFRIQVAPDQQLAQQAAAGNLIPLAQQRGARVGEQSPGPRQVAGNGE